MTAVESWPPPVTDATAWRIVPVYVPGQRGAQRVRVRQVRLWGQEVWVDEHARVWCPFCKELIDVDELAAVDNDHPVGLPYRANGRLMPMADDSTDVRAREPLW